MKKSPLKIVMKKSKIEKKWKNCRVLLLFMGLMVDDQLFKVLVLMINE